MCSHQVPSWARCWINVKNIFRQNRPLLDRVYKVPVQATAKHKTNGKVQENKEEHSALGMPGMLRACGLPLLGRHQSGIDDVRNIVSIVQFMLKAGCRMTSTCDLRKPAEHAGAKHIGPSSTETPANAQKPAWTLDEFPVLGTAAT
jgi:hypothetical protein